MICKNCGALNNDNAKFCAVCGSLVSAGPAEPAVPQPEQPVFQPYAQPDAQPFAHAPKKKPSKKKIIIGVVAAVAAIVLIVVAGTLAVYFSGAEQRKFIGTWRATVDMTDLVQEEMQDMPYISDYITVTDFSCDLIFTCNENGTYSLAFDDDSIDKATDNLLLDIKDAFYDYFENELREEYGADISLEDVMAYAGTSIDDLMDEDFSNAFSEALREELSEEVLAGNYSVRSGKLYLTDDYDDDIDLDDYDTYRFDSEKLVLTGSSDSDPDDMLGYPIEFEKVG